jgi:hypothetical protein
MANRRGETAREKVVDTIIKAFGDNYVGTEAKKIYVRADDGGEQIQFSITITMPKVGIAETGGTTQSEPRPAANPHDWTDDDMAFSLSDSVSAADKAKVQSLMKMLGF